MKRDILKDYPDDLLKVAEVAKVLRISPVTVYNLIDAGKLEVIKIGKSIRIHREDLLEYLDRQ
jgi:excisionase family DNA binding protein